MELKFLFMFAMAIMKRNLDKLFAAEDDGEMLAVFKEYFGSLADDRRPIEPEPTYNTNNNEEHQKNNKQPTQTRRESHDNSNQENNNTNSNNNSNNAGNQGNHSNTQSNQEEHPTPQPPAEEVFFTEFDVLLQTAYEEYGSITEDMIVQLRGPCRLKVAHSIGEFAKKLQIRGLAEISTFKEKELQVIFKKFHSVLFYTYSQTEKKDSSYLDFLTFL